MAEPYLSRLQALIARLNVHAKDARDISCKHFFGGAAAYVDGRIFMTLTPVGLALKLPEQDRAALFKLGAKPLRYFPKAPVKRDYALPPSCFMDDAEALNDWIRRSLAFARG